jgi:hypothetical protein
LPTFADIRFGPDSKPIGVVCPIEFPCGQIVPQSAPTGVPIPQSAPTGVPIPQSAPTDQMLTYVPQSTSSQTPPSSVQSSSPPVVIRSSSDNACKVCQDLHDELSEAKNTKKYYDKQKKKIVEEIKNTEKFISDTDKKFAEYQTRAGFLVVDIENLKIQIDVNLASSPQELQEMKKQKAKLEAEQKGIERLYEQHKARSERLEDYKWHLERQLIGIGNFDKYIRQIESIVKNTCPYHYDPLKGCIDNYSDVCDKCTTC